MLLPLQYVLDLHKQFQFNIRLPLKQQMSECSFPKSDCCSHSIQYPSQLSHFSFELQWKKGNLFMIKHRCLCSGLTTHQGQNTHRYTHTHEEHMHACTHRHTHARMYTQAHTYTLPHTCTQTVEQQTGRPVQPDSLANGPPEWRRKGSSWRAHELAWIIFLHFYPATISDS